MRVEIKTKKEPGFPMGARRAAAEAMGKEYVRIIRERTLRGIYGKGSGPYGTRRNRRGRLLVTVKNYNQDYAERKGYPLRPVTMGGPDGRILRTMRHGVKFDQKNIIIGILFDGAEANRLVEYHNTMGAGRSKILRRFVYATAAEKRQIVAKGMEALRNAGRG